MLHEILFFFSFCPHSACEESSNNMRRYSRAISWPCRTFPNWREGTSYAIWIFINFISRKNFFFCPAEKRSEDNIYVTVLRDKGSFKKKTLWKVAYLNKNLRISSTWLKRLHISNKFRVPKECFDLLWQKDTSFFHDYLTQSMV